MTQCFSGDLASIELVLWIVLEKPDLNVRTQVFVGNLLNRSVRLDVVATDSQNTKYDIEIQRAAKGAGKKTGPLQQQYARRKTFAEKR